MLGGSQSDVAWMLAASGTGTLLAALVLSRVRDRIAARTVMMTGAEVLVGGTTAAAALISAGLTAWTGTAIIWTVIGIGMALIITPTGKVLRASAGRTAIPEVFAAQFSLSHLAWLITYPVAGWLGTSAGFTLAWSVLAILAGAGATSALLLLAAPRRTRSDDRTCDTRRARTQRGPVHPGQGSVKYRCPAP